MHWGHVTTTDILEWTLEPVALAPDTEADCKGCFSGSAIDDNGKHLLAYTGVTSNDVQHQCLAVGDGTNYEKISNNPVITASHIPFEFDIHNFRDPKIWKKNGKYYLAAVLKQKNECGAMVMCESSDLKNWQYRGILDSSKDDLNKMWECPDVFTLDGKDMIFVSPQEMKDNYDLGFHNGNNSLYCSGKLDYETASFKREIRTENNYTAAQIDYGIDFYAPTTTKLKDGRTIMTAWMQNWEAYITPGDYLWSGMMILPRELTYKKGRLYQLPVKELETWKTKGKTIKVPARTNNTVLENQERHFEIDLEIKENTTGSLKIILKAGMEEILLEIDLNEGSIAFNREKTNNPGKICHTKAKLRTESPDHNLKILCDTCSMEVFIDNGIMAFTNTFFFNEELSDLIVENLCSAEVMGVVWKIKRTAQN